MDAAGVRFGFKNNGKNAPTQTAGGLRGAEWIDPWKSVLICGGIPKKCVSAERGDQQAWTHALPRRCEIRVNLC